MADKVNYHLEHMLPELDDLEKRGLFTRSEIKGIVKKRRDFEYLLKRHSPLKQDYLRYIEYEHKLEALRVSRKKALMRGTNGNGGKTWTLSLSDRTSCSRIMLIYERAVSKFKGDLTVWLQYLEYCRSQGFRKLQKVITKCLQLHPTVPGLWMYAAAFEFEHNLSMNAARTLMQRGLRMCPRSENLWIEYFRLELTYMQKLKARRAVLGLGPISAQSRKRLNRSPMKSEDSLMIVDEEPVETVEDQDEKHGVSLEDKLSVKLAEAIFKNAVAAVPDSLGFRHRFLEVLDSFEFEQKEKLENQMQTRLIHDFPADESSWDWIARRHGARQKLKEGDSILEGWRRGIKVFEEALKSIPSVQMYELYAKFLLDLLSDSTTVFGTDGGQDSIGNNISGHEVVATLLSLFERALAAEVVSESLTKGHLELLLRGGRVKEATELGIKFCNRMDMRKFPSLWEWRIALEMGKLSSTCAQDNDVQPLKTGGWRSISLLFKEALNTVPLADAKRIWLMVMEYYTGREDALDVVIGMLERAMAGGAGGKVGAELACASVDWILHSQGIKQARRVYRRFLALPGPSVDLFKHCISIETRTVEAGCMEGVQDMRKLFNDAVQLFGGTDTDLWLMYYNEEIKGGNIDAAKNVYWRAKKMLKDPSSFIERHQML